MIKKSLFILMISQLIIGLIWTKPYPINFSIPECKIVAEVPKKKMAFASLIPGNLKTYKYNQETNYYRDYQQAYFGFTWKKGGWDCMRHYEILANGCIPYFTDLGKCHANTMFRLPKNLISQAMQLEGVSYGEIDFSKLDEHKYRNIAQRLLDYTRKYLTTRSMAEYLLTTLKYSGKGKILFLGFNNDEDYLKTCTLIGLKEVLGPKVIDFPKLDHIYKNYGKPVASLYGKGFTLTKIIDDEPVDRTNIEQRIKEHEFELIIYGYVHYGRPFYATVLKYYSTDKIAYICGQDAHICKYAHLPNFFLREYEAYDLATI